MQIVIDIPEKVKQTFDNARNEDLYGNYYDYNSLIGKAIKNGIPLLELLEKTYSDFCECEGGEGCLKIDGKEYNTDAGYAIEGMSIFVEVIKQRLTESRVRNDKQSQMP